MDVLLTATITCDVITQNSGGDDAPEGGELSLQVLLGERLGEAAHVQVSTLDGFAARTGIRHLQRPPTLLYQSPPHTHLNILHEPAFLIEITY